MRVRIVTELCCYMDNEPGILGKISAEMAKKKIDLIGIQAYEGQIQSLVRMVADKPDAAEKILRSFGVDLISRPEIIQVLVRNEVGSMAEVTNILGNNQININSLYSTDSIGGIGYAYFRVQDPKKAAALLNEKLPGLEEEKEMS